MLTYRVGNVRSAAAATPRACLIVLKEMKECIIYW